MSLWSRAPNRNKIPRSVFDVKAITVDTTRYINLTIMKKIPKMKLWSKSLHNSPTVEAWILTFKTYRRTQLRTGLFFIFFILLLLFHLPLHLGTSFFYFWYPPSHVHHPCHPRHGFCHEWHSCNVFLGSSKIVNKTQKNTFSV